MTKIPHQHIVSLDSMTLVWGIRKKGQPDKVKHARYLFELLEHEEAQIIIPSVVIAEFVVPLKTKKEREDVIARMRNRFLIASFDARDAVLAAELWIAGKSGRKMGKDDARVCLKADSLIIATAYNHGAHVFYTDDGDCYKMAEKIMEAKKLPTMPPDLFGYEKKQ